MLKDQQQKDNGKNRNDNTSGWSFSRDVILISLMILMVIAGVVLSCLAAASCQFVEIMGGSTSDTRVAPPSSFVMAGMFLIANNSDDGGVYCMDYPIDYFYDHDIGLNFSKVAGVLAPIFGFLGVVILGLWSCFCRDQRCTVRYVVGGFLIAAVVCQALTFIILDSSACTILAALGSCRLASGSIFSFCAAAIYLLCAVVTCCCSFTSKTADAENKLQADD